ncbi:MAG: SHOCT domain-containing protein [Actinomycetota bacterium]
MFARRVARRTARRTAGRQDTLDSNVRSHEGYTVELEELAKLKERGLISDADFEAKKKQILGI